MKNIILIDFTPQAERTLAYAINFLKDIKGATLELVNVSDSGSQADAQQKLNAMRDQFSTPEFPLEAKELTGDLLEELPPYLNHEKLGFVFCGTHDMKFLDHIFSSRVLKLLNGVNANFVFVPESLDTVKSVKHVYTPILSDKHSLQQLEPLLFLKHFADFKLTLCTYESGHDGHEQTLYMASKILNNANVSFETELIGKSEDDLLKKLDDHARENDVNAISIVNFTEVNLFNFGAKGFVEKLIRNPHGIAIIAIQNKQLENYSGFHTMGGY